LLLSEDWLLISRTSAPLIYQPEFIESQESNFGLGDINQALFLLPTATVKRLGTEKWGVGPAAVGLTMRGPWVFGALAQNIWSFAGDSDRADVKCYYSILSTTTWDRTGPCGFRCSFFFQSNGHHTGMNYSLRNNKSEGA
jgi:hypothetical protein